VPAGGDRRVAEAPSAARSGIISFAQRRSICFPLLVKVAGSCMRLRRDVHESHRPFGARELGGRRRSTPTAFDVDFLASAEKPTDDRRRLSGRFDSRD